MLCYTINNIINNPWRMRMKVFEKINIEGEGKQKETIESCSILIIWGLLFQLIQINYKYLNIILPTIGMVNLYYSLYRLSNINVYLKKAYYISILNGICYSISLIINASPWYEHISNHSVLILIYMGLSMCITLALVIFLRKGMHSINKDYLAVHKIFKSKEQKEAYSLKSWDGMVLSILLVFISNLISIKQIVFAYYGSIISVILLVFSMIHIGSTYRVMNKKFYQDKLRSIRVSYVFLVTTYLAISFLSISITSILSNNDPVGMQSAHIVENLSERNHLIKLGVPEKIAMDLDDTHLDYLEDVDKVSMDTDSYIWKDGGYERIRNFGVEIENSDDTKIALTITTLFFMRKNKDYTSIVYIESNKNELIWNNGLYLEKSSLSKEDKMNDMDGILLYEQDSILMKGPWNSLIQYENMNEINFDSNQDSAYATMSYPFGTKAHRGYLIFNFHHSDNYGSLFYRFMIQKSFLMYPYYNIEEAYKNNDFLNNLSKYHNVRHATNYKNIE